MNRIGFGAVVVLWTMPLGLVWAAPLITGQPQAAMVKPGNAVSLSVAASGGGPLRYQWRLNGVNIPGAQESVLRIPSAQPANSGVYHAVVADPAGTAESSRVRVLVDVAEFGFEDHLSIGVAAVWNRLGMAELSGTSGTVRGSNLGATLQSGEAGWAGVQKRGGRSVWAAWRPHVDGIAQLNTFGSGFDTLLSVHTMGLDGQVQEVAFNDDRSLYHTSEVKFSVESLATYFVRVDGLAGEAGDIVLSWDLQRNSGAKVPKLLSRPRGTSGRHGSNLDLSVTVDSLSSIKWLMNGGQLLKTDNSIVSSVLGVFGLDRGDVGRYSALLASGDGVEIETEPVSVQLQIGGSAASGTVLADDKLADHIGTFVASPMAGLQSRTRRPGRQGGLASGFSGTQIFTTSGSTTEQGEPNHCGVIGGASEWYSYQAQAAGLLVIDTSGSDFDTVLAVYSGSGASFSDLTLLGCNDNAVGQSWSQVSIPAVAGATYFIAVDGVGGVTGTVELNYRLSVPPVLSAIDDVVVVAGGEAATVTILLSDSDSESSALVLSASSSNPTVVPHSGLLVGGSGAMRTLNVSAAMEGAATITVTVADPEGQSASRQFAVQAAAAPSAVSSGGSVVTIVPELPPTPVVPAASTAPPAPVVLVAPASVPAGGVGAWLPPVTGDEAADRLAVATVLYPPYPPSISESQAVSQTPPTTELQVPPAASPQQETIEDSPKPPGLALECNRGLGMARLRMLGAGGRRIRIEWTSDFKSWQPLITAQANDSTEFYDRGAAGAAGRFYRAAVLDE